MPDDTRVTAPWWRTARGWGLTLLALVAVLACVWLGTWQFDRAQTRATPGPTDPMTVSPVDLASVVPAGGRVPYGSAPVAVTVTGTYDAAGQVLVPGREASGVAASIVVTPLRPSGSDSAVLVARGSVPAGTSAPAPASGEVTVTGWLVPSELLEVATVNPATLPAAEVASVSAARVVGRVSYPLVDGYVGLVDQTPPAGPVPSTLPVPQIPQATQWSWQSLGYGLQWFFFALVVVWVWFQAVGRARPADSPEHGITHTA